MPNVSTGSHITGPDGTTPVLNPHGQPLTVGQVVGVVLAESKEPGVAQDVARWNDAVAAYNQPTTDLTLSEMQTVWDVLNTEGDPPYDVETTAQIALQLSGDGSRPT